MSLELAATSNISVGMHRQRGRSSSESAVAVMIKPKDISPKSFAAFLLINDDANNSSIIQDRSYFQLSQFIL
jgi:hypothetical protein